MFKKKLYKYRIIFLKKQQENLFFYKSIRLNSIENSSISFEKRSFHVIVESCSYINQKREFVFFIDYDTNATYSFHQIESVNPKMLDLTLKTKIVESITSGISNAKFPYMIFAFGIILGLFIMLVIYQFVPTEVPVVDPSIIPDQLPAPPAMIVNLFNMLKMIKYM